MQRLTLDNLSEAVAILRGGGVLVYPTETSYGLGCDATNHAAVERVFAIKGRPETKAMSVILPSLTDATKYIYLRPYTKRLAVHHWPGPLTIVAAAMPDSPLSPRCTNKGRHAVRISSHPFAAALTEALGAPIIATSANLSGHRDLYRAADVLATYEHAALPPDAFIDAGDLPETPPSTIVEVGAEGINVLRQGTVVVREVW